MKVGTLFLDCNYLALIYYSYSEPLTLLSSARNGFVTVYDVSEGEDGFTHLMAPPYALPNIPVVGDRRIGETVFRHPNDIDTTSAILLQMSDRGSIHRLDLDLSLGSTEFRSSGRTHDWSLEVLELEKTMETAVADVGILSDRAYTEVDLEPVYRSKLAHVCPSRSLTSCRDIWTRWIHGS